jgi:iron complex transport system substrate-binding protein
VPLIDAYAVGKILYPKVFADIDPKKKADEVFRFFVGRAVNDHMEKDFGVLGRHLLFPAGE